MFNKPPVKQTALHRPLSALVLMCRMCRIVGLNKYDLSYNYFYSIIMKQNKIRQEWALDRERCSK